MEKHDAIQSKVNEVSGEILRRLGKPLGLLFVHYISGPSNHPYLFRRTAIHVSPTNWLQNLAEKAAKSNDGRDEGTLHAAALDYYIQRLKRSSTFLNLVLKRFRQDNLSSLHASLRVAPERGELFVSKPELQEKRYGYRPGGEDGAFPYHFFEWAMERNLADLLAPTPLVFEFFRRLYLGRSRSTEGLFWEMALKQAQAQFFGRLCETEGAGSRVVEGDAFLRQVRQRHDVWNLAVGLQSALLYYKASLLEEVEGEVSLTADPEHSVVVSALERESSDDTVTLGVGIVSQALSDSEVVEVFEALKLGLGSIKLDVKDGSNVRDKISGNLNQEEQEACREVGRRAVRLFPVEPQRAISTNLSHWLVPLVTNLTGKVHEGERLEFYLAFGDASEFRDAGLLRELLKEEVEDVAFPDELQGSSDVGIWVTNAISALADEHYPWFFKGRYALFWDVSTASATPCGLVALRDRNWGDLVAQRFSRRVDLVAPSAIVGYVERDGHSGIVIVKPSDVKARGGESSGTEDREHVEESFKTADEDGKTVEEIASFSEGKWVVVRREKRRQALTKLFEKGQPLEQLTTKDRVVQLCTRVADDPQKGGIVALGRGEGPGDSNFTKMGTPWRPKLIDRSHEDRDEDLLALIAHDGASFYFPGEKGGGDGSSEESWYHRLLLIPDDKSKEVRRQLIEIAESKETVRSEPWPLAGKGARRWSAAMAAFDSLVQGVFVISQDGDIQFWSVEEKGKQSFLPQSISLIEARLKGEPRRFNFEKWVWEPFEVVEDTEKGTDNA